MYEEIFSFPLLRIWWYQLNSDGRRSQLKSEIAKIAWVRPFPFQYFALFRVQETTSKVFEIISLFQ